MKKMLLLMLVVAFSSLVFAEKKTESAQGEKISAEKKVQNKGLEKQLKILEKNLKKEGIDKAGLKVAKDSVVEMNEAGFTPEESRSAVAETALECLKQGIRGEELAAKVREVAQERMRLMKGGEEGRKKAQERGGKPGKQELPEEAKEKIRTGRPDVLPGVPGGQPDRRGR